MSPTVRTHSRGPTLAASLSHARLTSAWKSTVRPGLRRQAIGDLHDYLDVHRRIGSLAAKLHAEVIAGTYRTREPQFITWEKGLGITRRVVIPSPEDAIVLQALIDSVEKPILAAAPTSNAYYARSHAAPSIEAIDHTFPYPWWELWPEFQRRIWQFGRSCKYVVMTDIANYFDAIPLQTLRNRIVALAHLREETVDFLFFMLEGMYWRPDYIPASGVGLPQIQFDAPRLLANAYLFEVDAHLHRRSATAFVRWMDDINVGVNSKSAGKRLLRDLDEMLATMGLRINSGKTQIMSGKEALESLWMAENRRLNWLDDFIKAGKNPARARDYARARFLKIWRSSRHGSWKKIIRRYVSTFTNLGDPYLDSRTSEIISDLPPVRDKVFAYWRVLGYTPKRFTQLEKFITSGHCVDDVALHGALGVLWEWAIPQRSAYRSRAIALALKAWKDRRDSHVAVASTAGVLAKFASPALLSRFIYQTHKVWRRSEWAARQIAALIPALNEPDARRVRNLIARYGLRDAVDVILHVQDLRGMTKLDQQLRSYLLQPRGRYPYPFPKVLVALALFRGSLNGIDRKRILDFIATDSNDPRYVELLAAV